jgi:pimeloyl-ACP methyl ester carboxylesterase
MVGAEDTETPETYARAIAERIPGARLVVIPKAGHLVNVEAPDPVNGELRRLWLSGPSEPLDPSEPLEPSEPSETEVTA